MERMPYPGLIISFIRVIETDELTFERLEDEFME
jgi:hypothetical protein